MASGLVSAEWAISSAMKAMPVELASALGARIGERRVLDAEKASKPWVGRFYHNVEQLCGAVTPEQRKAYLIEFGRQMGRVYAEYTVLQKIDRQGLVEVAGREHLTDRTIPTIFVLPHLANWELASKVLGELDNPTCVMYEPRENRFRMRIAKKARQAWGDNLRLVSTDASMPFRKLDAELASGHNIAVLPDDEREGYVSMPALGRDLPYVGTRWMLSRLAVRHGIDVIPGYVERLETVRSRVTIAPKLRPMSKGSTRERAQILADQIDRLFDAWVRQRPEHWYWLPHLDLRKRHRSQIPDD